MWYGFKYTDKPIRMKEFQVHAIHLDPPADGMVWLPEQIIASFILDFVCVCIEHTAAGYILLNIN